MKNIILYLVFFIFQNQLSAYDGGLNNEIQIKSDNDFFIPIIGTDKYYTYGLKLLYRRSINKPKGLLQRLNKHIGLNEYNPIIEFEIGQEAFTPGNFKDNDFTDFDRPFAGYLYFNTSINIISDKRIMKLGAEVGIVGPLSFAGKVQNYFHENISHDDILEGWIYQVNNSPTINLKGAYYSSLVSLKYIDLTFENIFELGTHSIFYEGGSRIRLGRFNPISGSIAYQTSLSSSPFKNELFIDFTTSLKFVGYNATLQQSEDLNIFYLNRQVNNLLPSYSTSLNYNTRHFGVKMTYYLQGGDLVTLDSHQYGSIDLFFRF